MLRVVKGVGVVAAVSVMFYDNVGFPALVDGISMQPTLNPDDNTDVVFINRLSTRNYVVRRNDIVAALSPKDAKQRVIKRVIGVEGDVIRSRSYKDDYVDVQKGHLWVEGDNVDCMSLDSNVFGPISTGLVLGRAACIIWPPSRWQRLNSEDPLSRAPLARRPLPDILSAD